jgi:ankyrin repeat protein
MHSIVTNKIELMKLLKSLVVVLLVSLITPELNAQKVVQIIQTNNIEEFTKLIEKDSTLITFKNPQENSALHIAAFFGRNEMVSMLIEKGIEINTLNNLQRSALTFAIANKHKETVKLLIKNGISIRAKDNEQRTPMHWCAIQGNAEIAKLLIENGANIHDTDSELKTPLHWASQQNLIDVAEVLIKHGANVNVIDNHCRTPLFIASWNGHLDFVKLLIENDAIVDARYIGAASPLTTAAVANHDDICKYLINHNANIDLVCNMMVTPIYPAVINNNKQMVNYYLERNAKINYRDLAGRTPLYIAVRDGFNEIAKTLIEHGADFKVMDESTHRNLLHIAAANGRKEIAELLIKQGINPNDKDNNGNTPLDYAIMHQNKDVADYLLSVSENSKNKKMDLSGSEREFFTSKPKEAIITKLRNKTWGVSTASGFLVFGYNEHGTLPEYPSLANGCLTPDQLKDYPIYHFDGTLYSQNILYSKEDQFENIHYISSNFYANAYQRNNSIKVENIYFPETNKPEKISEIEVTALPAFGVNRRSYLIKADGLTILWLFHHSDRYFPWINNSEAIDYLKENDETIDLLFLGNTHSDMGPEWVSIMETAYEMAKELNVKAVFPMPDCKMGEYFYQERQRKGDGENVYFANNPGDSFLYKNKQIHKLL